MKEKIKHSLKVAGYSVLIYGTIVKTYIKGKLNDIQRRQQRKNTDEDETVGD